MENRVNSKEESIAKRVELGRFPLKPEQKGWLKYIKIEGDQGVAYAQPMVVKKLSNEERQRREVEKAAKSKAYQERVAKNKAKRERIEAERAKRRAVREEKKRLREEYEAEKAKIEKKLA